MLKKNCIILFTILLLMSCKEEEFRTSFIDPEFQSYVDSFIAEAADRGIDLPDVEFLTVEFSNELSEEFCGMGSPDWPVYPRVRISSVSGCWQDQTPIEKENFMFHELGHALLDRLHTRKVFDNKYPSSLMCSTDVDVYQCNNFEVYYAQEMKEYYVDELFDSTISVPSWISENVEFNSVVFDGEILENGDGWETLSRRTEDNNFFSYKIVEADESFALSIEQLDILPSNERYVQPAALWFRMFDVNDLPECSRLRAKARAKIPSSFDGLLEIALSLRERNDQGELDRFTSHYTMVNDIQRINEEYAQMEVEIPCVPSKTEVVTLSLIFNSPNPASVSFDEIEVSLWD